MRAHAGVHAAPLRARLRRLAAFSLVLGSACSDASKGTPESGSADTGGPAAVRVDLTGAGATFPYPLYARWFNDYATSSGVRINYESIGSREGISRVLERTADFGATDVPLSDTELQDALPRTGRIIHIPTVLGAVAVTYNLPGLTGQLRLSGDIIADVFLGRLTRWNDDRIRTLNPGIELPDLPIEVVHRSDGSGTSYIFSDYLTAVSRAWRDGPGRGTAVAWPAGTPVTGNEGMASRVKSTPGSIGYVEVVYARQNRLPFARVRNSAGQFATPMAYEISSAAAASARAVTTQGAAVLRVSLVNSPAEQAYPIASFTWLIVAPERLGPEKTAQLVGFLRWALRDGSDIASALGYVPLPSETADRVLAGLDTLLTARRTQSPAR